MVVSATGYYLEHIGVVRLPLKKGEPVQSQNAKTRGLSLRLWMPNTLQASRCFSTREMYPRLCAPASCKSLVERFDPDPPHLSPFMGVSVSCEHLHDPSVFRGTDLLANVLRYT